jgi:predicted permease
MIRMLHALLDDLRFGMRLLRKHLVLSAATILTFTIGVGLNAGVFTVIDGFLFRPRVAYEPASFVELHVDRADAGGRPAVPLATIQDYDTLARATSLRDVAAWTPVHAAVGEETGRGDSVALLVSCNFFAAYGPDRPLLGRLLGPEDCSRSDMPPVVVIGEDLWRGVLAADPHVIGSSLMMNRHAFTIVGVMPSRYAGQLRAPIWIPFTAARIFHDGRDLFRERSAPWLLGIVGRLRPGVSRTTAASELAVMARQLDAPATDQRTTVGLTGGAMIDTPLVREAAAWAVPLIMAAPAVVLLIAFANVAVLLLSRSMARQHEIAVRVSLGASRTRLLQMLLVESALLATLAAPSSVAVAYSAPRILRSLIPALPYYPFAVDGSVVAYLGAVTLFAGVAAGIAPALESLKRDVSAALHGHEALPDAIGWRARDVLVAAQVGMSLVLLVGAGLFLHAEMRLLSASPGYDADHVMLAVPRVSVPPHTAESAQSFYRTFVQRVRGIPGVRGVAYARSTTDERAVSTATATLVATGTRMTATATTSVVSSDYFRTLQMPMLGGTTFGDDAASTTSVVISESLARALWPDRVPVGETARIGDSDVSIAGVVRDLPSLLSGAGERTIYLPAAAARAGDAVYVGFGGGESETARAIRDAMAVLDANAVAQPLTLAAIRRDQAAKFLPIVEMVIGLGLVGLALGVGGIYGVVSFAVGRRTREIGIRIALGATRGDILRMVVRSSAAPVVTGICAGVGLALVAARTLARIFTNTPVHVDARDPIVYCGVIVLLSASALLAMLGPAERAAAADPIDALRQD